MNISEEDLDRLGFIKQGNIIYSAYRLIISERRCISLGLSSLGTPNEFLMIIQGDTTTMHSVEQDVISIHNYDYDGYLTLEKLEDYVKVLMKDK